MKIGEIELLDVDRLKVDAIISDFLGTESTVIDGVPPDEGRSNKGNQYRLDVDNQRYVSVKLAYDSPENIHWELFNSDMREILGLPHYKISLKNNFPLDSWKDKDYIIIDWGLKDRRFHMEKPQVQESLKTNYEALLSQLGQVAAQNYLFATADRKKLHFIWDLDNLVLFSIDHEMPSPNPHEITNYFRDELKRLYDKCWLDNNKLTKIFSDYFTSIFDKAVDKQEDIVKKYVQHQLSDYNGKFIERISLGAQSPLQRIMS